MAGENRDRKSLLDLQACVKDLQHAFVRPFVFSPASSVRVHVMIFNSSFAAIIVPQTRRAPRRRRNESVRSLWPLMKIPGAEREDRTAAFGVNSQGGES